jgi:hypothetical protein
MLATMRRPAPSSSLQPAIPGLEEFPMRKTPWWPAAAFAALLAAGAVHAATYTVEDAREGPVRAESRNTGGGAELLLSERRLSPRLVERLRTRLATVDAPADAVLRVTRAEVVLFVENAFATPGVVSSSAQIRHAANQQFPDELTVLRDASPSARREYRVLIEAEVGGRTIVARGVEGFVGAENRARLERAVAAALDDATRQLAEG